MTDAAFWQARWDEGKIGFHEGKPNRSLARWVAALEGPAGVPRRVLVPMAGKAVDVAWLAARGHEVVAVELVERAVVDFFAEQGLAPARSGDGPFERFEAGGVVFLCGDVFALSPDRVGPLDAIYDRAALIALDPSLRERYVALLASLLPAGGRVLEITFDHGLPSGPPFDLPAEEAARLWAPHGATEVLGEEDVTAESPAFTARGAARCVECALLVTRR